MPINMKLYQDTRGQSLMEVVLALAIFGFITAALVTMVLGSFSSLESGGEHVEAQELALEGIEAVKSIRDGAWNELTFNQSGVFQSGSQWALLGEGTTETIGQFTRTITYDAVCRNGSDDIVACPGSYTDVHTLKVTSQVSWDIRPGITDAVQEIAYLTDWESSLWPQTNWIGGAGQTVWSDTTRYDFDDGGVDVSSAGQVALATTGGLAGCQDTTWTFDVPGDYTYNASKIAVTGGVAELTAGDWWDTNYAYRRQIPVTVGANAPSGGYNGYTARIPNIDTTTLIGSGKMLSDCTDLRVTHWNGSSFDEIDRHVIGCNTANTDIRFQLQATIADSATDNDYFIYFV